MSDIEMLAQQLEVKINDRLAELKSLQNKAYEHIVEIDRLHTVSQNIIKELKPVEKLVFTTNPLLEEMFKEIENTPEPGTFMAKDVIRFAKKNK